MTRTAIVTGSASGIGAAVAAALEKDGYTVAGLDISAAAPYVVDVSDPAAVDATVARVVSDIGPVDAVVSADPFMSRITESGAGYVASYYSTFLPEGNQTMPRLRRGMLSRLLIIMAVGLALRQELRVDRLLEPPQRSDADADAPAPRARLAGLIEMGEHPAEAGRLGHAMGLGEE